MIITYNTPDDPALGGGSDPDTAGTDTAETNGTLILDATCAPQKCQERLSESGKVQKAHQQKIRKAIRQQLQYIRRDRKYIDELLETECELTPKQFGRLAVIDKVYEQQKYLCENKIHSVPDRIARIEKLSFDAYNESDVFIAATERYYERTSHYPERILADKIYRNRNNLAYCKEHGIHLSGSSLDRPKKNAETDKKTEYKDNADRVAVERAFALAKQKYGLGLITRKLDETTRSSIALSIIAINVDRICRSLLRLFYDIVISKNKQHGFMLIFIQNSNAENLVRCRADIK